MPLDKSNIHYTAFQMLEKLQATKQMHLLKEIQLNQFNFKHDREEVRERLLYISDLVRWRCTAHMSYRRRSCPAGRRAASHPWSSPLWRSVCSYRSKRDWTSPRAPSAPAPAPVNTHTQYHCMNNQHSQCCLPMCLEVCMRVWSITMTLSRESKPKYLV